MTNTDETLENPINNLSYSAARDFVETEMLDKLDNLLSHQETFSRAEVLRLIHKGVLNGFNVGATWAQENPQEAAATTKTGKLYNSTK